jgi:hypothetical protein
LKLPAGVSKSQSRVHTHPLASVPVFCVSSRSLLRFIGMWDFIPFLSVSAPP